MQAPSPDIGFPSTSRSQKELVKSSQIKTKKIHTKIKKQKKRKKLYKTKQNPQKQHPDNIFSIAAGMANKSHSLTHQIKACKATIFCVQETNFKKKGRNMNNE